MISLSPNGTTQFEVDAPSQELLVGTAKGVVRLAHESGRWHVADRSLVDCYISAVMPVPAEGLVFASVHGGTVHGSRDKGRSWTVKDNGIEELHVYTLGQARVEGRLKLYAGTEPAHLYESDDLGESWHELPALREVPNVARDWTYPPPPHLAHVKHVTADPWDPHVLFVCVEQGGLYRSEDGGKSWQWLSRDIHRDVHRLVIDPADPNRFYVTGGDGLYGSRDAGRSWTHLSNRSMRVGYPDALVQHPRQSKLLFMAGAIEDPWSFHRDGTANARVARSQDGGQSWEILTEGFPDHLRGNVEAMAMEVWSKGYRVFAGTTGGEIYCSGEGGRRWTKIIDGLPPISKLFHYEALERGAANFRAA